MIYAIARFINEDQEFMGYELCEPYSDSTFFCGINTIIEMIQKGTKIKNLIYDGELKLKHWPYEIATIQPKDPYLVGKPEYILIEKGYADKFKVAHYNGFCTFIKEQKLIEEINKHNVANCIADGNSYKCIDAMTVTTNNEYKQFIDNQYNTFIAKASALGLNMSFKYEVEDTDVIYKKFTGHCEEVIIPNFVTIIGKQAFDAGDNFDPAPIFKVQLSNKLRIIGNFAFFNCSIRNIVIPDTVELIGVNAFDNNKDLFDDPLMQDLNTDKFKVSKNTYMFP